MAGGAAAGAGGASLRVAERASQPLADPVAGALFDYGETLAGFERPDAALAEAYERIREQLQQQGLQPPLAETLLHDVHDRVEEEFDRHCRSGNLEEINLVDVARRAYADLGLRLTAAELDTYLRMEQEAWWTGVHIRPDAISTLEALRAAGIRVGLCSNAPYRVRSMHDQLAHFGLRQHLDAVTFSGEVGWRKPHERIFRAALSALGTSSGETVMVGDSERDDIAGAHAVGMRAVLYRPDTAACDTTEADAVISRLSDVVELLNVVPVSILNDRP